MQWLASNWIWVALVVGMLGMHLFGHGGHGGHGGRRDAEGSARRPDAGS